MLCMEIAETSERNLLEAPQRHEIGGYKNDSLCGDCKKCMNDIHKHPARASGGGKGLSDWAITNHLFCLKRCLAL